MQLRAELLQKKFDGRRVVSGVSLSVSSGEVVGLLGPNGAGKSTTFHMLVGFLPPDEGRVFMDGADVSAEPMFIRARKGLGYLAQEPTVFRGLSVEDNLKAILERIVEDPDELASRVEIGRASCRERV